MSNQMEYKCPACGGALAFDSASQKLKCPFCDSVYNLDQFEQQPDPAQQAQAQQGEQPATGEMCIRDRSYSDPAKVAAHDRFASP